METKQSNAKSPSDGNVEIHVFEEFDKHVSKLWIKKVVGHVLTKVLGVNDELPAVDIAIVDDEVTKHLNALYLGHDEPTDVLSFPFKYAKPDRSIDYRRDATLFIAPDGEREVLGEVIVSYPQVQLHSTQSNRSVKTELAHLLIHGVLHLLGYDHEELTERTEMETLETQILSEVCRGG